MRYLFIFVAAFVMTLGGSGTQAQELGPGDIAPPFNLPGSDGDTHRLSDYGGKTVVIAWFPKAFTGG